MKIQINTDKNIQGTEALESSMSERIQQELNHFSNRISRIEVHLSDQNSFKKGVEDIHCKMEARMEGRQPVAVLGKSDSKDKALVDAIGKMKATLTTIVGKMSEN